MENFFPLKYHPMLQLSYALLIVSSIPFAFSEIRNARIVNDSREKITFQTFGFLQGGRVSISIKDISWKSSNHKAQLNTSSMGFYLYNSSVFGQLYDMSSPINFTLSFCILSSQYAKLLFTFEKLTTNSTYNFSTPIDKPEEYTLSFANCQQEFEVSMDVHTEMYNLRNGQKDFLSAGTTNLPMLYFIFFLIYTSFFIIWVFTCIKQRLIVYKIHIVMGALLLFKGFKMICAFEQYIYVRKTGTPHGWDVAFYVFGFFKGIMLFTVIVLIGTGWSFLKPYLQKREKIVLMIVIPLQVVENIAYVVLEETGPAIQMKDWLKWKQIFFLVDIICCCAIFFPIAWSIKSLREASKTDGKAARNVEKLIMFKTLYTVLVGYLYFTRVFAMMIGTVCPYEYKWVQDAITEAASLAFYVFIFSNFKPMERNPYLEIDEEEENAAGKLLEEDDTFEL